MMPYNQATLQEDARRELTRALALTIAYRAAVDDEARLEVVAHIAMAVESAFASVMKIGFDAPPKDWRQLPCGCWERFIHGNIVTSDVKTWTLVQPCEQHREAARV